MKEKEEKFTPEIKPFVAEPYEKELHIFGSQVRKAPQNALTDPDATAFSSSVGAGDHVDASAITILNNMRTRIGELETVLVNLGFLKQ